MGEVVLQALRGANQSPLKFTKLSYRHDWSIVGMGRKLGVSFSEVDGVIATHIGTIERFQIIA